jgi:hypothetical protein
MAKSIAWELKCPAKRGNFSWHEMHLAFKFIGSRLNVTETSA